MTKIGEPSKLVPRMIQMIAQEQGFWLVVTGGSMAPALRHLKDRVYISPLGRRPRRGDILLTTMPGNRCLLHRVVRTQGNAVFYRGDALRTQEGPLPLSEVIGIVTMVERDGRLYRESGPRFRILCALLRAARRIRRLCAGAAARIRRCIFMR